MYLNCIIVSCEGLRCVDAKQQVGTSETKVWWCRCRDATEQNEVKIRSTHKILAHHHIVYFHIQLKKCKCVSILYALYW